MATSSRTRNNTIAGFFVMASIVAFVAVIITLSGVQQYLRGSQTIEVIYAFDAEGIPGLEVGAEVAVGMRAVGRVRAIRAQLDPVPRPDPVGAGGAEQAESGAYQPPEAWYRPHWRVLLSLPPDYVVCNQAVAELVVPLLGSGTMVNLRHLNQGIPLEDGQVLAGSFSPSVFLQQAGIGDEQIGQIQAFIGDLDEISGNIKSISGKVDQLLGEDGELIMADARGTLEDIRAMIEQAQGDWDGWLARVDSILEDIETAANAAPELATDIQAAVDKTNEGLDQVTGLISDVEPDVKATAANVREVTDRVKQETLDKIHAMLDDGQSGLDTAIGVLEQVDALVAEETPTLKRVLGNARIASDNLKLTTVEVRAEPWRLLYTPSDDEVRETLRYDAVRTYANAVSDLNAATASLKALHDAEGAGLNGESEALQRILSQLDDSFAKYQEAERLWFEQMLRDTQTP